MTKRTLIMAVHGAGLQGAFFGALAPHLLDFALKAVTLPGHDARRGDAPLADIQAMAAWLAQEIDALPAEYDVVLLGHSMGALASLEAAAHPRVKAAVLLGAADAMPVHADLLQTARDNPAAAAEMVAKWGIFRGHAQADTLRTVLLNMMAAVPPSAIGHDLAACDAYKGAADAAARVQKPVLVLAADSDKMTPLAGAQALADMLPQSTFAIAEGAGHMFAIENPLECAKEIKAFLQI